MSTSPAPDRNCLWVGLTTDQREIVVNHPQLLTDENGCGHIVFSAAQARNLAQLLNKHADTIDPPRLAAGGEYEA